MELKTGASLQGGKYKIEKVLGKGGFGITYLAYQQGLNRYVAVKEFFMSDYCNREETTCAVSIPSVGSREMVEKYKSKFVKEAQTIAELDNPHIVPIYDVFEENGTAYYVMKHIGGGSLSSLVKKGKAMPVDIALKYVRQVAEALAYCHERNIAHLDVKPGNILIQDGVAVLIDFGISKHYNEDGDQTSSTPIGISKGYAPLEQYKKGGVTTFSPVTDIYSLGAVLFRLVTGQTPPDADEVNEEGLPEFPSDIPQYVQDAITAAMQPKKKDRPQSVDDLLALLVKPTVEDVDEDDSEDTELEDEDSEDTELTDDADPSTEDLEKKRKITAKPLNKKLLYGVVGGLFAAVAVVPCILWGISSSAKRELAESDQTQYLSLISSADSLSRNESSLSEAMALYDSAAVFETQYAGTRFSDFFGQNALSSSSRVQSQIDSIAKVRQKESEEKLRRELAAAEQARLEREQAEKERLERERLEKERAEKERIERERKEREEAERKRRETGYSNGILKVNGIEYPMVYVSGGSFMMGSDESDADTNERPVHRVTLSSYRIGKYEVTQELWEAVMGSNPSYFKGSRRPVENVSWDNCQTFIRKLNSLTGQNFKLPTEAQWEFAARGGNSSSGYKYSGSNYIDSVAWYDDNSGNRTHDVGTKSPNELGIYDMSGNALEWCSDRFGSYGSDSVTNPSGSSGSSYRVLRGGGWGDDSWRCRVSKRDDVTPSDRYSVFGLRLCL